MDVLHFIFGDMAELERHPPCKRTMRVRIPLSPPIFPRFCASGPGSSLRGVDRYMTVFQADVAGAIPASGTIFIAG